MTLAAIIFDFSKNRLRHKSAQLQHNLAQLLFFENLCLRF